MVSWVTGDLNLLCQNPTSIYVHIQGQTSTTDEYCGGTEGKNKIPRSIKNIENIATVKDAEFMRGIKCTTPD